MSQPVEFLSQSGHKITNILTGYTFYTSKTKVTDILILDYRVSTNSPLEPIRDIKLVIS